MDFWADPLLTKKFSSGDTYAVVFQEDPEPNGEATDPRDTPFFALCYKDNSIGGDSHVVRRGTTWPTLKAPLKRRRFGAPYSPNGVVKGVLRNSVLLWLRASLEEQRSRVSATPLN